MNLIPILNKTSPLAHTESTFWLLYYIAIDAQRLFIYLMSQVHSFINTHAFASL
jgi:hypothetical protein